MFFSKLKENLKKTKEAIDIKISNVFANNKDIDEIMDELNSEDGMPEKEVREELMKRKKKKQKNLTLILQ